MKTKKRPASGADLATQTSETEQMPGYKPGGKVIGISKTVRGQAHAVSKVPPKTTSAKVRTSESYLVLQADLEGNERCPKSRATETPARSTVSPK